MDPKFIDQPAETRQSERLDAVRLERYLRQNLEGFDGSLEVRQFRKGHSNLTYSITDGTRDWVLRRAPFGTTVKSAHDMGREHQILSRLYKAYPPAPQAQLFCQDDTVVGADFYVMDRVKGTILRRDPPKGLTLDAELAHDLGEAFVRNLVAIHQVDLVAADLHTLGKPHGYIERQVSGWTRRYDKSATDDLPAITEVAAWLADKQPDQHDACLIHNDYKFDNLVLDPSDLTSIIGVLDWEMSTVGHPLMDLGSALSYWVQDDDPPAVQMVRMGPTHLPGMPTRETLIRRYGELAERDMSDMDFFTAFGLFKTAVVLQQIYFRYKTGKTDDERFAMFIHFVKLLAERANQIVSTSSM